MVDLLGGSISLPCPWTWLTSRRNRAAATVPTPILVDQLCDHLVIWYSSYHIHQRSHLRSSEPWSGKEKKLNNPISLRGAIIHLDLNNLFPHCTHKQIPTQHILCRYLSLTRHQNIELRHSLTWNSNVNFNHSAVQCCPSLRQERLTRAVSLTH